jgi:hypothetical protein
VTGNIPSGNQEENHEYLKLNGLNPERIYAYGVNLL